jgi:hypothetical protein
MLGKTLPVESTEYRILEARIRLIMYRRSGRRDIVLPSSSTDHHTVFLS